MQPPMQPPGPPGQPPGAFPPPFPMVPGGMPGTDAPGAMVSLVCGIIALALVPFGCCTYGITEIASIPLAIVAVVFGFRARGALAKNPSLGGSGKAMAGLICGIVAIALAIIVVIVAIIGFASLGALQNAFPSPSPR